MPDQTAPAWTLEVASAWHSTAEVAKRMIIERAHGIRVPPPRLDEPVVILAVAARLEVLEETLDHVRVRATALRTLERAAGVRFTVAQLTMLIDEIDNVLTEDPARA